MIRVQQEGRGLGSDIRLTLIVKKESEAKAVFEQLWAEIQSFEKRFSRFQADSELSTVNASAGEKVAVSSDFQKLLAEALKLSKKSGGIYEPLILPALQKAGYTGSWPETSTYDQRLDFKERDNGSAGKDIILKDASVQLNANTALDFGGIGKGYLLDQLSGVLLDLGVNDYWMSLGGDIICSGHNLEQTDWQVGIADALRPDEVVSHVVNRTGQRLAIATSGITKRKGEGWHHIIDPRTGAPADTSILTATVTSNSATEADVFAKCIVIVGQEQAAKFADSVGLSQVIIQVGKGDGSVTITVR
ncbi:MAG TPA: FAD:protein FMN transferase [Candidatus Saccharimonadales bacterium]|nr:FAD:protein FMN transferase [Candidatus Saccharimonadales bacterium]